MDTTVRKFLFWSYFYCLSNVRLDIPLCHFRFPKMDGRTISKRLTGQVSEKVQEGQASGSSASTGTLDSIMVVPFLNADGTAANFHPPKYLESALLVLTWMLISAGVLRQLLFARNFIWSCSSPALLPPCHLLESTPSCDNCATNTTFLRWVSSVI